MVGAAGYEETLPGYFGVPRPHCCRLPRIPQFQNGAPREPLVDPPCLSVQHKPSEQLVSPKWSSIIKYQFNPNQDQLSIIFPFDQAWLDTHFKNKDRIEVVIFKASNVLTPKALQEVTIKTKSLRNKTSQKSFPSLRCSHCTRRYRALKLRGNSLRTFAQGEFSIHPFIS